ncbi:hypothetical protein [Mameliella sp.]|uniref:hypothetical protein n=1 Tax=Mameliella sp. TaxID=1924940 RepID=UPI003BACC2C9
MGIDRGWVAILLILSVVVAGRVGYNRGIEAAPAVAAGQAESSDILRDLLANSTHRARVMEQGPETREEACDLFFDYAEQIIADEFVPPDM